MKKMMLVIGLRSAFKRYANGWVRISPSFNDYKTELILFGPHHNLSKVSDIEIAIGDYKVKSSQQLCNIVATYDCEMEMDVQITNVCKSAWHQLHQIGKNRQYLSEGETRSIIHVFVISKLYYNNGLLCGLPDALLGKPQRVQNACAKLIFRKKMFNHITDLMRKKNSLATCQT